MTMQPREAKDYLKVPEFAKKIGVHPKTVSKWIREDAKLPPRKRRIPAVLFGSRWYIPRWFAERHGA